MYLSDPSWPMFFQILKCNLTEMIDNDQSTLKYLNLPWSRQWPIYCKRMLMNDVLQDTLIIVNDYRRPAQNPVQKLITVNILSSKQNKQTPKNKGSKLLTFISSISLTNYKSKQKPKEMPPMISAIFTQVRTKCT